MGLTAKRIRENLPDYNGTAHLYQLSEPFEYDEGLATSLVVSSAIPYAFDHGDAETMTFPAALIGESVEILTWCELSCIRGEMDHDEAVAALGYDVEEGVAEVVVA